MNMHRYFEFGNLQEFKHIELLPLRSIGSSLVEAGGSDIPDTALCI